MVLPSRMELLVMPTSVWAALFPEPPQAASKTREAARAARRELLTIEIPPNFMHEYLNSLGVGWSLSSLPITGPAQPPVERPIRPGQKADQAVRGEDHEQDQDDAVAHGRAG